MSLQGNHHVLTVYEDPYLENKNFEITYDQESSVNQIFIFFRGNRAKWINSLKKLYYFYLGYQFFVRNYGKPDLIHAHIFLYAGMVAWMIKFLHKIPYIITEHSSFFFRPELPSELKWVLASAAKKASFILPVSDHLKSSMVKHHIDGNFQIIGNVIDCQIFQPIQKNEPKNDFQFLHISGFTPEKNLQEILLAVKLLSETRDDFILRIAGDGDLSLVQKMVTDSGIPQKLIEIKGEMTEADVAREMQACDVFLMYSHFETFSVVTAEALATGKPVIFSDIPAKALFEPSGGLIIVKPNDPTALAKTMDNVIEHPPSPDPASLHQFIAERYGKDAISAQLTAVYNEVIRFEYRIDPRVSKKGL